MILEAIEKARTPAPYIGNIATTSYIFSPKSKGAVTCPKIPTITYMVNADIVEAESIIGNDLEEAFFSPNSRLKKGIINWLNSPPIKKIILPTKAMSAYLPASSGDKNLFARNRSTVMYDTVANLSKTAE